MPQDTRVFGASVLLAEWGKPKTGERLRTRGSQGPDESLGHANHMEQERGAFKVEFENEPLDENPGRFDVRRLHPLRNAAKAVPQN